MSDKKKKNKKQTIIIIILALVIIGCIVTIVVLLSKPKQEEPAPQPAKGTVGVITDNWDTDVSVPKGSSDQSRTGTQIPGYSYAEMKEGDTSLKIRIGNPKDNHVGFYATMKLSDGTVLYESPLLQPGQGLDEIPLTQTLKKGEYDAVVVYKCVILEDGKTPINSAESGLKLYVD